MNKVKIGLLALIGLSVLTVMAGCSNDGPPAPPGPAVGTTTPTGGVISAEGRKSPGPHMMRK